MVTRGAQRVVDSDTVAPDQSCLWGFGRAAALEFPHLWGGLADLADGTTDEWSRLVNRISAPRDSDVREDQIALREHAVYVPGWSGAPGSRAAHRCTCARTQRIS